MSVCVSVCCFHSVLRESITLEYVCTCFSVSVCVDTAFVAGMDFSVKSKIITLSQNYLFGAHVKKKLKLFILK